MTMQKETDIFEMLLIIHIHTAHYCSLVSHVITVVK